MSKKYLSLLYIGVTNGPGWVTNRKKSEFSLYVLSGAKKTSLYYGKEPAAGWDRPVGR